MGIIYGVWTLLMTAALASTAPQEAIRQLRAREADPVALFAHEDPEVREEAVEAYGGVDEPVPLKVKALTALLRDPARGVRAAAIRQLGLLPVDKALPPALGLLKDADPKTRAAACELIASWGPLAQSERKTIAEDFAATLRRYPRSEPWPYTVEYAWAAAGVRDAQLGILQTLLRDPKLSPVRRAQVVRLIGRLGVAARAVIPDLQQLLKLEPRTLPVRDQWERAGIDGDLTAAREVLPRLTVSK